jgi:hypothetical protein
VRCTCMGMPACISNEPMTCPDMRTTTAGPVLHDTRSCKAGQRKGMRRCMHAWFRGCGRYAASQAAGVVGVEHHVGLT